VKKMNWEEKKGGHGFSLLTQPDRVKQWKRGRDGEDGNLMAEPWDRLQLKVSTGCTGKLEKYWKMAEKKNKEKG